MIQYAGLVVLGLSSFYRSESPSWRAASLGLVFPGAGLLAVSTIPSIIALLVSTALIPLVLFAWFGAGGVLFPILLWTGTSALAGFLARDKLFDSAGPIAVAISVGGIAYMTFKTSAANAQARQRRQARNDYLVQAVQQNQAQGKKHAPGSRELDLRTLRFVQWFVESGLSAFDDFSHHDVIDQFQTAAVRYQIYDIVNNVGLYQYIYAPNFHGYVNKAQRNSIEKSLTEKVVGFWKYESLWGKFNAVDWDPIVKDDIMVSGYVLQAVGIYQSNTGDDRYTNPGSLEFVVDKNHKYKYDFRRIADAVKRNWDENAYCLYPCEPNWIYTVCNLVGVNGMMLADRLLGIDYAAGVKQRFEAALNEEFTTQDGSIVPIRSELTGFTIPGLVGALSDGINAILCAVYLPHIAHRNWAFAKQETIKWNKQGKIELNNLVGADKIDAGNYKSGVGAIRATFAQVATEYGDQKIRDELIRQIDDEYHPPITTPTGAIKNKGLSTISCGSLFKARIGGFQDWVPFITEGPPANVFRGPILEEAAFPEVLVAKAYSHDGDSLELVLYNGKEAGTFSLGFKRLQPGKTYHLGDKYAVAAADGTASFEVAINGRTALMLTTTAN